MADADAILKVCDIYDWDGKGEIDLFFLGDVIYALGMNTTKKGLCQSGPTDEEGKKFAKFDEVVEKVNAAKAAPDSSGTYADYISLLKLYDKQSNGIYHRNWPKFLVSSSELYKTPLAICGSRAVS